MDANAIQKEFQETLDEQDAIVRDALKQRDEAIKRANESTRLAARDEDVEKTFNHLAEAGLVHPNSFEKFASTISKPAGFLQLLTGIASRVSNPGDGVETKNAATENEALSIYEEGARKLRRSI